MRRLDDDVLVLCYHGVGRRRLPPCDVHVDSLRAHLEHLLADGYRGVTFSDAVAADSGPRVAVTFDDGNRSVVDNAMPLLAELGLVATVFVPTERVATPGHLTWDDLGELASHGWEVGSHGATHRRLTQLAEDELDEELATSRAAISGRLGRCDAIAYPYGAVDGRVRVAAARAGYTAGCTVAGGTSGPPLAWPRVTVARDDDLLVFRLKIAPAVRALRTTRVRGPLNAALRAGRAALTPAGSRGTAARR